MMHCWVCGGPVYTTAAVCTTRDPEHEEARVLERAMTTEQEDK